MKQVSSRDIISKTTMYITCFNYNLKKYKNNHRDRVTKLLDQKEIHKTYMFVMLFMLFMLLLLPQNNDVKNEGLLSKGDIKQGLGLGELEKGDIKL